MKIERTELDMFRKTFQKALETFIKSRVDNLPVRMIDAKKLAKVSASFVVRPGKRMRPYLAIKTATTCNASEEDAMKLGLALELFHAFALVHDDIMDRSEQRRGQPTVHAMYATEHEEKDWKGSSSHYGTSNAILSGDLLYTWAEKAFDGIHSSPEIEHRLSEAWNTMKEEVILGQTLDVVLGSLPHGISRKQLLDVLALKSGRYSIGRPIILGYILAGADFSESAVLAATEPLGLAFQIQDDILGTFGDIKTTGKDTDSDIKEGKMTMLAWEARRRLEETEDLDVWERAFGSANASKEDIEHIRSLMEKTGARVYVETLAEQLIHRAIEKSYELPLIGGWFTTLAESLRLRKT